MHPALRHVIRFFAYDHLPPKLQEVSRPFGDLAQVVAARAPDNDETAVALRKLLEAKDAAVRAVLSALCLLAAAAPCATAVEPDHALRARVALALAVACAPPEATPAPAPKKAHCTCGPGCPCPPARECGPATCPTLPTPRPRPRKKAPVLRVGRPLPAPPVLGSLFSVPRSPLPLPSFRPAPMRLFGGFSGGGGGGFRGGCSGGG